MSNGCRLESSLPVAMTKWFVQQAQVLFQKNNNNKFLPKGDRDEMQAVYALFFVYFLRIKKKNNNIARQQRQKEKRDVYLLQAAHEVVANGRSGQVGRARASSHIEEIIRA